MARKKKLDEPEKGSEPGFTLKQLKTDPKVFPRPYLTTAEVAQLFGFSVRVITEWAVQWHDSGGQQGLRGVKMGRNWRFDREQIQVWLRDKQFPSRPFVRKSA